MDYALLQQRALRAIDSVDVRSGILPSQSNLRRNDEQKQSLMRRYGIPRYLWVCRLRRQCGWALQ